tara:strand:- start:37 stop:291 length:255 start_codon:yes stop_codon:yes gene_type:complete
MTKPNYEFDPEALNELWNNSPNIKEQYGMLTGGALLRVLRHLRNGWEEIEKLDETVNELRDQVTLCEEAYEDLLVQQSTGTADA